MKICPNCQAQLKDDAAFCVNCGAQLNAQQTAQPNFAAQQPAQPVYAAPAPDPFDHTAEFDPKDISDNKVVAMLVYLMGAIGIIIALLASNNSKYAGFHLRQALKFLVLETLTPIALFVGFIINIIPIIGWIAYGLATLAAFILLLALQIVKIVCFFSICNGKAKEPAIVRWFGFLK